MKTKNRIEELKRAAEGGGTTEVHVTRVAGDDVYGHTTDHCDAVGCNGYERYFGEIPGTNRGDVIEVAS